MQEIDAAILWILDMTACVKCALKTHRGDSWIRPEEKGQTILQSMSCEFGFGPG